jgi:hypothetical protein
MKYIWTLSIILVIVINTSAQNLVKTRECVIANGQLTEVDVDYNQSTGERTLLVNGVRKDFYSIYPKTGAGYAGEQSWYINSEKVQFKGKSYVKYGLPRVLGVTEIVKAGAYNGVGIYTEAGITGVAEVIYIPVRQRCEFQPYQRYCGSADIEKVLATKTTMQFKVTTTDIAGKPTFTWSSNDVKIIKGQGTATVTVDLKGKKPGDIYSIFVKINGAKDCPVTTSDSYRVE